MDIHQQIRGNKIRSTLIMALFIVFVATVGYVLGEASGFGLSYAGIALIISGVMSIGSYYFSDRIVLALSNARPADKERDFDFYTAAENMAIASGLPKPRLYVIEEPAINAFATGRDPEHAVVVATRGLLRRLDRAEIEGVVAHEISHIKNFDTRLMGIVAVLVGSVAILADIFMRSLWFGRRSRDRGRGSGIFLILGIVFAILAPIVATLIQLAVSRRREYLADATAANLTRNPEGLASALEKIAGDTQRLRAASNATAHLYISNPFRKTEEAKSWFVNLFNTHPPIEKRTKALRGIKDVD